MKANLVYNVVDQTDDQIKIAFNGFVGDPEEGNDAKTFANLLNANQGKKVLIQINSPGGYAVDGLHIHDLLAQHPSDVRIEVYGATASAATIISQAGYRAMSSNAMMLIHKAWGLFIGNSNALLEHIETLELMDSKIMDIHTKKGADKEKVYDLMQANNGNGKWISADEALQAGLVDEVFEPADAKIAASAEMIKNLGLPELPELPVQQVKNESSTEEQTEAKAHISERNRRLIQINKQRS